MTIVEGQNEWAQWTSPDGRLTDSAPRGQDQATLAASNVLAAVKRVRSWIPSWRRSINAVLDLATAADDAAALDRAVRAAADVRTMDEWSPSAACAYFAGRDQASQPLTARNLVGEQAELLVADLHEADQAWLQVSQTAGGTPDYAAVKASAAHALAALQSTLQHALMLTFLGESQDKRVGSNCDFDDYCSGWGLPQALVDVTWLWVTHDPWIFGGHTLPLVADTKGLHRVYRKARTWSAPWFATTLAPLWGAALVYGLVAALFGVLHQAGLTHWPHDWPVKLVVLVLFIALGAIAHMASRSLSAISYDDPLQVYVADQALDWLSLRWLAILRAYLPILVVAVSLWGAGNIPTKFQDLATALLAGYSADSLFQAGLSKLSKSQSSSATAKPVAQASLAGTATVTGGAQPGATGAGGRP